MSGDSHGKRPSSDKGSPGSGTHESDGEGGGPQYWGRTLTPALRAKIADRRSGDESAGDPVHPTLKAKAEKSLGSDISDVRVHQGPDARQANAELGSKAFAIGNEVVLGGGTDNSPNHVLAHEVAHTVQQRGAAPGVAPKLERGSSGSAHESDADQAADRLMLGLPARVSSLGAPQIQCFDSFEHLNIGDEGGGGKDVTLECGVTLTYGEVIALSGDFFGSPEKLMKAKKEEVLHLRGLIHDQAAQAKQNHGKPNDKQGAENEKKFEAATMWREDEQFDENGKLIGKKGALQGTEDKSYSSLAKKNTDHFSPRNMEAQYAPEHERALSLAAKARDAKGQDKTRLLNEAYLHDGFAGHFLTDAFASGHLVSGELGRRIGEVFYKTHEREIFESLSSAAADDQGIDPDDAAGQVGGMMGLVKGQCGSVCLKLVHDLLNGQGLEVQNKRGDAWITKGDDHLAQAPRAEELAAEAVRLSREEVDLAVKTGQSPEPRAMQLVPALIGYQGQVLSIQEFTNNPLIFERYLRPLLLDRSKNNPLYALAKANLGFAKLIAQEGVEKYGRRAIASGQQVTAGRRAGYAAIETAIGSGVKAVGRGVKAAGEGIAEFATGGGEVAQEKSEIDHELIENGGTPVPKYRR